MGIMFTRICRKRPQLEPEVLGYDASLVAHLEEFHALGIDVLGLQCRRQDDERALVHDRHDARAG